MPRGGYRVGAGRPKRALDTKPRKPVGKSLTDIVLSDLCKAHTEDAVKCLAAIMNNKKGNENARISAAKELLDRGHGKSVQVHEGDAPETNIVVITNVPRSEPEAIEVEAIPMIEAAE